MLYFLAVNPVFQSFIQADFFGKGIFFSLFALSILTWTIIINKYLSIKSVQKNKLFIDSALNQDNLLTLHHKVQGPFTCVYHRIKLSALELLNKNGAATKTTALSSSDIQLLMGKAEVEMGREIKLLSRHLSTLTLIASLAPFLGLLGTVWGIQITFSELQMHALSGSQAVMGGLAMALATTVLGLLVAIPALIGHSLLKAKLREITIDMDHFNQDFLAQVELQYRKVEC